MRKVVFERYGPPEVLDVVERDEPDRSPTRSGFGSTPPP
jgi:hypothetical protein